MHFDQAGQKASRRAARVARAERVAPRPLDLLRPVVRAPTVKYNRKVRSGRGFTFGELKAAKLAPAYARTIGIAVDHRRQNRNQETFDANVKRLQDYLSKLIVFPRNGKAQDVEQVVSADAAFPVQQKLAQVEVRAVPEQQQSAFRTLRLARSDKKFKGIREKRAREQAEAEAEKKK